MKNTFKNVREEECSLQLSAEETEGNENEELAVSPENQSRAAWYAVGLALSNIRQLEDKKVNLNFMAAVKAQLIADLGARGAKELMEYNHQSIMNALKAAKEMNKAPKGADFKTRQESKQKIREIRSQMVGKFKQSFEKGRHRIVNNIAIVGAEQVA